MRSLKTFLFLLAAAATSLLVITCGSNPPVGSADTGAPLPGLDAALTCPGTRVKCGSICCPDGQECNGATTVCETPCVPNCGTNTCGMDPVCGSQSCGTCQVGNKCQSGGCVACAPSQCGTKQCGKDVNGCVCGTCTGTDVCDSNGMCVSCGQVCAGKCGFVGACNCGACDDGGMPIPTDASVVVASDASTQGLDAAAPGVDAGRPGRDASTVGPVDAGNAGVLCGSATCDPGMVCCVAIGDAGPSSATCNTVCPTGDSTLACDGPEDCTANPGDLCCATVKMGAGTLPNCPIASVDSVCQATCVTSVGFVCPAVDTLRLCHSAANCASDPSFKCCAQYQAGSPSVCLPSYLGLTCLP